MKVHHLKTELYSDPSKTFRIHMSLRRKNQAFVGVTATKANEIIQDYLLKNEITTHAWILLPDRVSMIIQPSQTKSIFQISEDLQKLIKSQSLPEDANFYGDFLDHILRTTEDPKTLSAELLQQSVTLGLAASPKDYTFCGSLLYSMDELSQPLYVAC